jgi:hypothetical protein
MKIIQKRWVMFQRLRGIIIGTLAANLLLSGVVASDIR